VLNKHRVSVPEIAKRYIVGTNEDGYLFSSHRLYNVPRKVTPLSDTALGIGRWSSRDGTQTVVIKCRPTRCRRHHTSNQAEPETR